MGHAPSRELLALRRLSFAGRHEYEWQSKERKDGTKEGTKGRNKGRKKGRKKGRGRSTKFSFSYNSASSQIMHTAHSSFEGS